MNVNCVFNKRLQQSVAVLC